MNFMSHSFNFPTMSDVETDLKAASIKNRRFASPGPCRHHRAAGLGAELSDGAVQHVDLVEEIHG